MGSRLIVALQSRGHAVHALVRSGSEKRLPQGCTWTVGNVLDRSSYIASLSDAQGLRFDTYVHLVGVTHPNPAKADEFRAIDLGSLKESVQAAVEAGISNFVFVSVAQPAPVMRVYIEVRAECERFIRENGLNAVILRPWYVLGPGRWWPYLFMPLYWLFELLPFTRAGATRLGLVTSEQMLNALVTAVENPSTGVRIITVPEIRKSQLPA